MGKQRLLDTKQFRHPAGGLTDQRLVLFPFFRVGLQGGQTARLVAAAHGLRQCQQIPHGQVEALPGHRVQGVSRIAHHHRMGHHLGTGFGEDQRITLALADGSQPRRLCRAAGLQLCQRLRLVHGHPLIHLLTRPGPYQRKTLLRQRQQGQRAIIEETLVGNAFMGRRH